MICKCGETAILNSANGIEFYYCRSCKAEVTLEEAPKDEPKKNEDEWPFWHYSGYTAVPLVYGNPLDCSIYTVGPAALATADNDRLAFIEATEKAMDAAFKRLIKGIP